MRKKISAVVFLVTGIHASAPGSVRSVEFDFDYKIKAPRWMFDPSEKVPVFGVVGQLYNVKKSFTEGKFEQCISQIKKLRPQAKSLQPWLAVSELQCARGAFKASRAKNPTSVIAALTHIEGNKDWLMSGPQVENLRRETIGARLEWLEVSLSGKRQQAWQIIDWLVKRKSWLTGDELARTFRFAGELAFLQQNLTGAYDFYNRSLQHKDSADVRDRVKAIQSKLLGKVESEPAVKADEAITFSAEENKILNRMRGSLANGDWVSAVEDGVTLIRDFPGSRNANWAADRVGEIFLRVAEKEDKHYLLVKERLLRQMLTCDAGRLVQWLKNISYRNFHKEAITLGQQALAKLDGHPESTRVLLILGNAGLFAGNDRAAEDAYTQLIQRHAGTSAAQEALFRIGLMKFRRKDFIQSVAYLERMLALPEPSNFELQARYWLWRALQKTDKDRATTVAAQLVERYPLTYYGLRARAENNGNELSWPQGPRPPLSAEIWLTESESLAWERLNLLLAAGWMEEAQAELAVLPPPRSGEEKILRARLWSLAFDHYRAVESMTQAWEERPDLVHWAFIPLAFPDEFSPWISREAKLYSLDQALVKALIKQESSFRPRAVSSSNAYGLMQLVMPTALEVARDLKWNGTLTSQDLFQPEINIRFGTYYLRKLIRAFDGHVPMALAAYNLGIGRFKRWLSSRVDTSALFPKPNSDPQNEIWIDELPWSETSFYVKAVMRNMLIYRLLENGKVTLEEPMWK